MATQTNIWSRLLGAVERPWFLLVAFLAGGIAWGQQIQQTNQLTEKVRELEASQAQSQTVKESIVRQEEQVKALQEQNKLIIDLLRDVQKSQRRITSAQ